MATKEPKATDLAADATKFAAGVVVHGVDGNGKAVPASSVDPAQVYSSNSYARLLDDGLVKTGPGTLANFAVGAAGTTITVTFYDGLSTAGAVMFGPYTLVAGVSMQLNLAFAVGLHVEFSATTGTPNIVVGYR